MTAAGAGEENGGGYREQEEMGAGKGGMDRRRRLSGSLEWRGWEPVASVGCYALCSILLNIANKAIFSSVNFHFPWLTLVIQNMMAVFFFGVGGLALRPFDVKVPLGMSPKLLRELLGPTVFFALFLVSNAYALRFMSLPILTIFKSFAPLGITLFELIAYGDSLSPALCLSLATMVLSNMVTISNDVEASFQGYLYASASVLANILYVFSLRYCISERWNIVQRALWGNLLGAIMMFPIAVLMGELSGFVPAFRDLSPPFMMLFFGAGMLGCMMSYCTYWASSVTRGSTISFTGAMTKIPVVVLGYFIFDARISPHGWCGISLGLLAGLFFAYVKSREARLRSKPESSQGSGGNAEEFDEEKRLQDTAVCIDALKKESSKMT